MLFVDDEDLIRDLGRQVLEMHGYTVLLAEDGRRAIELFETNRDAIDLVVLDLTMPHRSGLEVLRAIRKIDPGKRIILSSGNMPSEEVPGTAFLPKLIPRPICWPRPFAPPSTPLLRPDPGADAHRGSRGQANGKTMSS